MYLIKWVTYCSIEQELILIEFWEGLDFTRGMEDPIRTTPVVDDHHGHRRLLQATSKVIGFQSTLGQHNGLCAVEKVYPGHQQVAIELETASNLS